MVLLQSRIHVVEHTRDAVDSDRLTAAAGPAWGVVSSAVQTVGALRELAVAGCHLSPLSGEPELALAVLDRSGFARE